MSLHFSITYVKVACLKCPESIKFADVGEICYLCTGMFSIE